MTIHILCHRAIYFHLSHCGHLLVVIPGSPFLRPAFGQIALHLQQSEVPILLMTASWRAQDTIYLCSAWRLREPVLLRGDTGRPNIAFQVWCIITHL
jgi:hypothetical protein